MRDIDGFDLLRKASESAGEQGFGSKLNFSSIELRNCFSRVLFVHKKKG